MTGNANSTYSADAFSFVYALIPIESGKGPDEFLKSTQQNDEVTLTTGLDGESVFNIIKDTSRLVTLTLLYTSKGNAILSAYLLASRKVEGGLPAPLAIKDRLGTTTELSAAAMIKKMPDMAAAKEAGVVVWEFLCADSDAFIGSH
jgi:hypothetical protein